MGENQGGAETVVSKPYWQVLFATDFSDDSERVLIEAMRFARLYGSRLHLLNVVVSKGDRRGATLGDEDWDHSPVKNRGDMEILHRSVLEHHPEAVARVWRDESLAGGINNYATRQHVDLIVMGPGPRSRLREAWRGSITQVVARTSPVSVLIPFTRVGNRRGVLVPIDFSPESRRALVHASHLAVRHKQKLSVLHVVKKKQEGIVSQMEKFVAEARLLCPARCLVGKGDVAKAIVDTAAEVRAEVLVVGSAPRPAGSEVWSRGILAGVLRRAKCPVLVYREPAGRPPAGGAEPGG